MKKLTLVSFLFLLASCASTHGTFITDKQDAWIDGHSAKSNGADRGLLFCRANVKEDGLADPVCYETRFEEFEDEAERVGEEKEAKKKK